MGQRLNLQILLESITPNVYFQPPAGKSMSYPCIVYNRYNAHTDFANNLPYRTVQGYLVTVIDPNPDSEILGKVAALPMCSFNRHFTADNLNHDIYYLYY